MFNRGLVIGKFCPPHRGHKHLIDTAQALCAEVTVLVCRNPRDSIDADLRARWLSEIHPKARVQAIVDIGMDDDSKVWAEYTMKILGYSPDAVFTSEKYGDLYAQYMNCAHVCVDRGREKFAVSGTAVRNDPFSNWDFLEPPVRAHLAKRFCIVGAESTGKTTLAKALAERFKTVWVPEYGRLYSEGKFYGKDAALWNTEEFVTIAREQCRAEDALSRQANRLVICDTDAFATTIWHERYMGVRSLEVEAIARERKYDLYFLAGDEIPFVQDGVRDGEHIRHDMQTRFMERLEEEKRAYVVLKGPLEERLAVATGCIERVMWCEK